jgi:hypothetical protein
MRSEGHTVRMENMTHTHKSLVRQSEEKISLGRLTHRCKSNIKMDFKEMVCTDWIQPTQDSSMAHLIIVMYLQVPQKFENSLNSCQATISSQRLLPRVRHN